MMEFGGVYSVLEKLRVGPMSKWLNVDQCVDDGELKQRLRKLTSQPVTMYRVISTSEFLKLTVSTSELLKWTISTSELLKWIISTSELLKWTIPTSEFLKRTISG